MHIEDDQIFRIVENIWKSLMGSDVSMLSSQDMSEEDRKFTLVGCIQITGAWDGAVALHCTREIMQSVVQTMFGENTKEFSNEEIEDALGELANMTAGNIKALLPGPSQISLPTIIKGSDFLLRVVGSEKVNTVYFNWNDQILSVSVFKRLES